MPQWWRQCAGATTRRLSPNPSERITAKITEAARLRSASRSMVSRLPIADEGPAGHRPSYLLCDLGTGSAGGIGDAADCDLG